MTLELGIISFVIGATFGGFGFKVMIMVPAVLAATLLAAVAGVSHADHLWSIIVTMILVGMIVQIGYLTGLLIRAVISTMRRH
jgi:hypothetical protein